MNRRKGNHVKVSSVSDITDSRLMRHEARLMSHLVSDDRNGNKIQNLHSVHGIHNMQNVNLTNVHNLRSLRNLQPLQSVHSVQSIQNMANFGNMSNATNQSLPQNYIDRNACYSIDRPLDYSIPSNYDSHG